MRWASAAVVMAVVAAGTALVAAAPALAATSNLPIVADQTYQANDRVDAILPLGNTVYIGGLFTSVRPPGAPAGTGEVTRQHLAAFDRTTGALLPWNPGTDKEVLSLTASLDGASIFVGGTFARLGGLARGRLAQVDAATGAVLPWAPMADLQVNTVAVTSTLVYVGGTFDTVNGQPRTRLAAVDYSGALSTTWVPTADDRVRVITPAPDGQSLFVGGDFLSVNGSTTQRILSRLDPTTGATLPWINHPGYPIYQFAFTGSMLLAAGDGSGGHIGAFNLATGALIWTEQTDGGVQSMTVMNGVVYGGGHFDNVCVGVTDGPTKGFTCPVSRAIRHKLVALDPVTGALDPWNPGANSPLGVYSLANLGGTLMVGGVFTKLGSPDGLSQATHNQQAYGQFTPSGNASPVAAFTSSCTQLSCTFDGSGSTDSDGTIASYAWDFGDAGQASGLQAAHTFATAGTYQVKLTVTDNLAATGSTTVPVTVSVPVTSAIAFRAGAIGTANATVGRVTVPAAVQPADVLLLFATTNTGNAVTAGPTGWTLLGQQTSGSPDERTLLYEKVASSTDPGSSVAVTYAATTKIDLQLAAWSGVDNVNPVGAFASTGETVSRATHTTPGATVATDGSWVVSYWADKSSATTTWTLPAGQVQRGLSAGTSGGHISSELADTGTGLSAGAAPGVVATADSASSKATMWTVILDPAP